jgi:hypothetical protein
LTTKHQPIPTVATSTAATVGPATRATFTNNSAGETTVRSIKDLSYPERKMVRHLRAGLLPASCPAWRVGIANSGLFGEDPGDVHVGQLHARRVRIVHEPDVHGIEPGIGFAPSLPPDLVSPHHQNW